MRIWLEEQDSSLGTSLEMRQLESCIHVSVWQKPVQYYKVISLQLIKKKEEENRSPRIALDIHTGCP